MVDRSRSFNERSKTEPLLEVRGLQVSFETRSRKRTPVIDAVDFAVQARGSLGVVGESGSGKTMLCRTLIGTHKRTGAVITGGTIKYLGRELTGASEREWRKIRGVEISYVPQSSLAGLNPVLPVGTQLVEIIRAQRSIGTSEARTVGVELLERVRVPRASEIMRSLPYELSGGMRQRVLIALAISSSPRLLIADEPTTALDVSIQKEILELLRDLQADLGMALVFVSHDLAVIEELCEDVMVMYAGASIESGAIQDIAGSTAHPYTGALLTSRVDQALPNQDIATIGGESVPAGFWPPGCRFWPRCPISIMECKTGTQPRLAQVAGEHRSACIRFEVMVNGGERRG